MSVRETAQPEGHADHDRADPDPHRDGEAVPQDGAVILRQLSTGATAIRKRSARPTGMATVLKKGAPTVDLLLGQRLVEERVDGAEQHHEGEADEERRC